MNSAEGAMVANASLEEDANMSEKEMLEMRHSAVGIGPGPNILHADRWSNSAAWYGSNYVSTKIKGETRTISQCNPREASV